MTSTRDENATDFCWTSDHWWNTYHELVGLPRWFASVRINGSSGIARLEDHCFKLKRFRLPHYVTIRDARIDELIVRFCLIPKSGFFAEFADGGRFRLGWTDWCKGEWIWKAGPPPKAV